MVAEAHQRGGGRQQDAAGGPVSVAAAADATAPQQPPPPPPDDPPASASEPSSCFLHPASPQQPAFHSLLGAVHFVDLASVSISQSDHRQAPRLIWRAPLAASSCELVNPSHIISQSTFLPPLPRKPNTGKPPNPTGEEPLAAVHCMCIAARSSWRKRRRETAFFRDRRAAGSVGRGAAPAAATAAAPPAQRVHAAGAPAAPRSCGSWVVRWCAAGP